MGSGALLVPVAAASFDGPRASRCAEFLRRTRWPALLCGAATFGGGVLYTLALEHTTVGVSTALTRTKPVFIFLLSVLLSMASCSSGALAALALTVAGIACLLVAGTRQDQGQNTGWGVCLTLAATFIWACSDVYIQHVVKTRFTNAPSLTVQMFAFQGATNLWTLLACWPVPIITGAVGDGPSGPPPASLLPTIFAACAFLVLTNLSVGVGIACSSALFMGVASLLSIPVAFAADWVLHGLVPDGLCVAGACCVVAAFLALTLGEARRDQKPKPLAEQALAEQA